MAHSLIVFSIAQERGAWRGGGYNEYIFFRQTLSNIRKIPANQVTLKRNIKKNIKGRGRGGGFLYILKVGGQGLGSQFRLQFLLNLPHFWLT